MSVCLPVCQSVCLSVCRSVCLCVCSCLCVFVCMSVRLSVCPSVRLSVRPSVCLSVWLSVSQSLFYLLSVLSDIFKIKLNYLWQVWAHLKSCLSIEFLLIVSQTWNIFLKLLHSNLEAWECFFGFPFSIGLTDKGNKKWPRRPHKKFMKSGFFVKCSDFVQWLDLTIELHKKY